MGRPRKDRNKGVMLPGGFLFCFVETAYALHRHCRAAGAVLSVNSVINRQICKARSRTLLSSHLEMTTFDEEQHL